MDSFFCTNSFCSGFRSFARKMSQVLLKSYHLRNTRGCRTNDYFWICSGFSSPVSLGKMRFSTMDRFSRVGPDTRPEGNVEGS